MTTGRPRRRKKTSEKTEIANVPPTEVVQAKPVTGDVEIRFNAYGLTKAIVSGVVDGIVDGIFGRKQQ